MMKKTFLVVLLAALVGCAAQPTPRSQLATPLPTLDKAYARLSFTAGKYKTSWNHDLKIKEHVGPVFINNQMVGMTAYREYFIVDVQPGTYEAYCTPEEPLKNKNEKRQITANAGDQIFFQCDVVPNPIALSMGLIGLALVEYASSTVLVEAPLPSDSKLVAYTKLQSVESSDAESRLKQLQKLRKDGVITEKEYQQKKKQIVEKL